MTGGKAAVAVVVGGLLVFAGTALGANWGSHRSMMASAVQAQGVTQAASYRQFRGQITSVHRGSRAFWMRTSQSGRVHIGVTSATRWSGNGCTWSTMQAGRHITVHAYRHNGAWMAAGVQPWMGSWDDDWGHMYDHMSDHMGDRYDHMGYGPGR